MPSQDGSHLKVLIGANIDRGIAEHGLKNREVGEKVGATEHQVWRWRNGKHVPNLDRLMKLSKLLFDGDMAELYAEPDPDEAAA